MTEKGIYYPDGSFASRTEIRRKLLADYLEGGSKRVDPVEVKRRDFGKWTEIITRQQSERKELLGIPESVEIEIQTSEPILVGLFGDVHSGGGDVDYDRFARDVDLIKEAKGYSITLGDLTDSFFFMPEVGEQIVSGDEQVLYMQSALDELAKDDRLLAAWSGDHDMWSRDKSGAHTLYQRFGERYNAHYLEGVSYVTLKLNDGGEAVKYGFVGSHRHKGFSVYNDAHASLRQWRDEGMGSVISLTAHNHVKALLTQVHKLHKGEEFLFHSLAMGTYKKSDRYSRKMGWPRKGEHSAGAFGIVLHPGKQKTELFWTLDEAVDSMAK